MKKLLKPGCMTAPLPCVMVSCSDGKQDNIITIAWTGIINSEPPMTYISVRPSRHSYSIIKKSREFIINLASRELVFAMDHCGVRSGRDEDKFETMKLTRAEASLLSCPMIAEAPINIECRVKEVRKLASHDMFMAEIVAIHVDDRLMQNSGRIAYEKAGLVGYAHGEYYGIEPKRLGSFGYSVMKPGTAKKRRAAGRASGGSRPHWEKELSRADKDDGKNKNV